MDKLDLELPSPIEAVLDTATELPDLNAAVRQSKRRVTDSVEEMADDISEDIAEAAESEEPIKEIVTVAEETAEDVIEAVVDLVAEPEGRVALSDAIDGKSVETRSDEQADALDQSFDQLQNGNDLKIEVLTAEPEETRLLETDHGEFVDASLEEGEDAKLVETASGQKVLVLDEDLTAEQAELATKEVLAEIIGETVEENGGFVDVEFYNLFVEGNFTVLSEDHYKYSADYGGYLAISDEMG
jgi:hypothetical protein